MNHKNFAIVVLFTSSRIRYNFTFGRIFCCFFLDLCQSTQPSKPYCEQSQQPSEREGEQCKQSSEQEGEQSKQLSEQAGKQSRQPKQREGEHCKQPSERQGEKSEKTSDQTGEQSKQPSELDTPHVHDIFSLLAEVQQLRKVVIGLERRPKKHKREQARQPTKREGQQSKQPSEHETADDMFSLLADIKELTKIAIERRRQKDGE